MWCVDNSFVVCGRSLPNVDQYLAAAPTFNALPPGMRSMLTRGAAPARMMGDQHLPHHQTSPGAAAAAAAAPGDV